MIIKAQIDTTINKIDPSTIHTMVNGYKTITILGGEFAIVNDSDNVAIKTLLGSCVAIMFYDTRLKIIGMNHFLLPSTTTQGSSLKFGLFSVESMLNEMYKLGSIKKDLVAKIAGGGHILIDNDNRIGDKNVDFAIDFCNSEGFDIISEHTRGEHGRVILLTKQFQTFIRVVKNREVEAEISANEKILYSSPKIKSDNITLF